MTDKPEATPEPAPSEEAELQALAEKVSAEIEAEDETAAEAEAEPEGDSEEQPEGEEAPTYEVKVGGQTLRVTLEELTGGYSRTQDYKAKTAAVADERRQVEASQQAVAERLTALDAYLESLAEADPILAEEHGTNWVELLKTSPDEYHERQAALTEAKKRRDETNAARREVQFHAFSQTRADESRKLAAALPAKPNRGRVGTGRTGRLSNGTGALGCCSLSTSGTVPQL